ncbi:MAG TPA: hypothetical protein VIM69_11485, partial [Opitutaceae bacterium]
TIGSPSSGNLVLGQWNNGAFIGTRSAPAAADVLRLGTGYLERMRIDQSGNVGIGTTTPSAELNLARTAAYTESIGSSNNPALRMTNLNSASFGEKAELQFAVGGGATVTSAITAIYSDWTSPGGSSVGSDLAFSSKTGGGALSERMRITSAGNVGIGTTNPTQKLSVNGAIRAKEVIVDTSWSDYVFDPNYKLATMEEVEAEIKKNNHLPGIPSAKDVAEKGISVGQIEAQLLAKIEEITLHQISQEKQIDKLKAENTDLRTRLQNIEGKVR